MSAWLVSCTHIRAMVSAAVTFDKYDELPAPDWAALAEQHPEAFCQVSRDGKVDGHALSRGWRKSCENELGRALWLANVASLRARYPGHVAEHEEDERDALAYRHALVELPVVALIKAVHCYAYQACEVPDWETCWAKAFCDRLEAALVRNLPGYDAAPWGIDDPEGGAPEPGTAGAPVSLMSMMRRA